MQYNYIINFFINIKISSFKLEFIIISSVKHNAKELAK